MKLSYQWLRDYVAFDLSPDELSELLSQRGMELEAMTAVGDDVCYDFEITANRPDLLSHIGVAREIAAATGLPLQLPDVAFQEEEQDVADLCRVEVYDPELCPRYTARVLTDVQVGPAPADMQRRLETIGLRPVNNIVDITNYVLMECGQPEHAFDFDKLTGNAIIVRPAEGGEHLDLIDGAKVTLEPENLVIADSREPVALAGIMGGLDTEIGDGTTTVLLESARFDPVNIRRSTRSTGKSSDSSYRFERGVDVPTVEWASRRAASLMQQHAGARIARGVVDVCFVKPEPRVIQLRIPRIEQVLGVAMAADDASSLLEGIGFGIEPGGDAALAVTVPSFRADVALEIDLIEELARCYGYDNVPEVSSLRIQAVAEAKFDRVERIARHTLLRLGYHETVTSTFVPEEWAVSFSPWSTEPPVLVRNPLRSDEAALRRSLVPSLVRVKKTNQDHGTGDVHVFEMNRVYVRRPGDSRLPEEITCLTALGDSSFHHVKGAAEAVFEQLGLLDGVSVESVAHPFLTAGAAACWRLGPSIVGYVGELSDEVCSHFGLRSSPCVCEIDLDGLVPAAALERKFRDLPRYPAIVRDLAIVVDRAVSWDQVRAAVEQTGAEHLEGVTFGEVYTGKQVEKGKKSLFFSLVFRADDRTLTHDEVTVGQDAIVAALADRLGATLRA